MDLHQDKVKVKVKVEGTNDPSFAVSRWPLRTVHRTSFFIPRSASAVLSLSFDLRPSSPLHPALSEPAQPA